MRTITITGMSRPHLFAAMLGSLRSNNLDGWRLLIAIDGGRAHTFADICRQMLGGRDFLLTVNAQTLGIRLNPYLLLSRAFSEGSRLNVYLEEDLIVSPDALDLALWYERHHRPTWACLNFLSGPSGSAGFLSNPVLPGALFEARTFNSLGFAARAQEWDAIFEPAWLGPGRSLRSAAHARDLYVRMGWDWSVSSTVALGNMVSVQPVLARATHIGAEGDNCTPRFQRKAFGGLEINRRAGIAFELLSVDDLPYPVRSHLQLHEELLTRQYHRGRSRRARLVHKLKRLSAFLSGP